MSETDAWSLAVKMYVFSSTPMLGVCVYIITLIWPVGGRVRVWGGGERGGGGGGGSSNTMEPLHHLDLRETTLFKDHFF